MKRANLFAACAATGVLALGAAAANAADITVVSWDIVDVPPRDKYTPAFDAG